MHYLRNIIDTAIQQIKELFSEYQFKQLRNDQFPQKSLIAAWKGSIICGDHNIDIIVGIPTAFPDELPKIYLTKDFKSLSIPHFDNNRFLCTFNSNAIDIFSEKPKEIIIESIEKARDIISSGISGNNEKDFEDEFLAYWSDGEPAFKLFSILTIHDKITEIKLTELKLNNINGMICGDSEEEIKKYIYNLDPNYNVQFQDGLFIPLGSPPSTPFPKSNKDIFSLLQNKNTDYYTTFIDFLKSHDYKGIFVFSVIINNTTALAGWYQTTPSENKLLKGFRPKRVTNDLILSRLSAKKIVRYNVERLDSERLYKRIGQDYSKLNNKKVCLIGCGSIGSNIAMHLVKSGIEDLILIDNEVLSPENIYRHVCGMSEVGQNKSEALSKRITSHFPHTTVLPFAATFHEVVLDDSSFLQSMDLIISATGNTALERRLNHMQFTTEEFTPLLFAWIEPYGVASHAVLISNKNQGCFECCLDQKTLDFIYSVGKFTKGDTLLQEPGCQTVFSPYSAIHSESASIIATKLALSFLSGDIRQNKRLVLINDMQILKNKNVELNLIYNDSSPNTLYQYAIKQKPNCSCCGS